MIPSFAALVLSTLLTLVITPIVRRVAWQYGFLDRPDNDRKLQRQPVAYGGGLVLLIGLAVGSVALIAAEWHNLREALTATHQASLAGIMVGAACIVLLGLIDDRIGMSGKGKLLGQLIVVGILISFQLRIDKIDLFGREVDLGSAGLILSAVWLLGAINSFNLMDGVDGFCGTLGTRLQSCVCGDRHFPR